MTVVIIHSPNGSGWFILAVLALVHPVVPFVEVLGAAPLGVTAGGIGLIIVVSKWGLAIFGVVTDIGPMGVAVILYLSPGGLVGAWRVGVWWCACTVPDITYVTRLD